MRESESFDFRSRLLVFTWIIVWLSGFSGHMTPQCATPGAGFWFLPADITVLTFTANGMKGYDLVGAATSTEYDCMTNGGNNIYSDRSVKTLLNPVNIFFCWKLVQQSANVMLLYELTGKDTTGYYGPEDRVVWVGSSDPDPSAQTVCSQNISNLHPKLLYKVASASATDIDVATLDASKLECPAPMLNTYSYVMGTDCQGKDSSLDFCQDSKTARLDYSLCTDKPIMFTDEGFLSCLGSYTQGQKTYTLLGNHDVSVSGSSTLRFVCVTLTSSTQIDAYDTDCSSMSAPTKHNMLTLTVKKSCRSLGADLDGDAKMEDVVIGKVNGEVTG